MRLTRRLAGRVLLPLTCVAVLAGLPGPDPGRAGGQGEAAPAASGTSLAVQLQAQSRNDVATFLEGRASERVDAPRTQAMASALGLADVTVVVLAKNPFGRATYLPGHIILDAAMEYAPDAALAFVLAHEYGHHTAGHWLRVVSLAAQLGETSPAPDSTDLLRLANRLTPVETVHAEELEADRLAREHLVRAGHWSGAQVRAFFLESLWSEGSATHPATTVRLRALGLTP